MWLTCRGDNEGRELALAATGLLVQLNIDRRLLTSCGGYPIHFTFEAHWAAALLALRDDTLAAVAAGLQPAALGLLQLALEGGEPRERILSASRCRCDAVDRAMRMTL
jgi:hypothetical protein